MCKKGILIEVVGPGKTVLILEDKHHFPGSDRFEYVQGLIRLLEFDSGTQMVLAPDGSITIVEDEELLNSQEIGARPIIVCLKAPSREHEHLIEKKEPLRDSDRCVDYSKNSTFYNDDYLDLFKTISIILLLDYVDWFLKFKVIRGPRPPNKCLTKLVRRFFITKKSTLWRPRSGSNRRIKVLQTSALPLGYVASKELILYI